MKELNIDERISKEIKRLNAIFKDIDKNKLKTVKSLIENVAFMAITLEDLQSTINVKGCVEEYQNGANQKGYKKTSEVEVYNTMIKNYASIIKQLTDLTPTGSNSTTNELLNFLGGGSK